MKVFNPKWRTAVKEHNCTWCAEKIEVGERYVTWSSVEDTFSRSKMHAECYRDANELADYMEYEYIPYSNIRGVKDDVIEEE